MEAREASGKTVEEAIELALSELGLSRSEVEIEVLQESRRGILGWGGGEARVKVSPIVSPVEGGAMEPEETCERVEPVQSAAEASEVDRIVREVAEKLLMLMNVPATVAVNPPVDPESPLMLDISGDDPGVLIGRRGRTLSALQYMVNFIASRQHKSDTRVIVDVAGYRQRRQEELKSMALRIGDLVKTNRRSITLEPMLAWERRAVHLTLGDDAEITTGSIGFGDRRKVVVSPKRQGQQRDYESKR